MEIIVLQEMINQADNLILQAYYTTNLIVELKNNKFLKSDFFQGMTFGQPAIKEELKIVDVDNQGSALMALYAMLVIPKEILKEQYSAEYAALNEFLQLVVTNTVTNYPHDSPSINFVHHIRNSVAHARVEFVENDYVLFRDKNKDRHWQFETRLPLNFLGEFIGKLQRIHMRYISDRLLGIEYVSKT